MGRFAPVAIIAGLLAACMNPPKGPPPPPSQSLTGLVDLSGPYQALGRIAAGRPIPFVGSVSEVAAAGDSTLVILALSLENRALQFDRESGEFVARYRVDLDLQPTSGLPIRVGKEEAVRVATFAETQRADESVLFQQMVRLLPGSYHYVVTVRDVSNTHQSRAEGEYQVPALSAGTTSAPLIVYQVKGRAEPGDPLSAIMNPRGTVYYGGDTVLAYVEAYRLPGRTVVPFVLRDQRDSVIWRDSLPFQGRRDIEAGLIRLSPDSLPLGKLELVVGPDSAGRRTSLLVVLSPSLLITDFDQIVSLLRYYPNQALVQELRTAPPSERPRVWRQFFVASDPNPGTPQNETLDEYFTRVAVADQSFGEGNTPGWQTDRGEVFITLGQPDDMFQNSVVGQGQVIRWSYDQLRLILFFQDRSGLGQFRLTPTSRSDFDRAARRIKQSTPQ